MKLKTLTALTAALVFSQGAQAGLADATERLLEPENQGPEATPAPEGAKVYIISPADGETVSSPLIVKFGLQGMGVAPAGTQRDNTGHHHLLIDDPDVDSSKPLPTSEQVIHFGGGQTETEIKLDKGEHSLQLLLGDYKHQPHQPVIRSPKITITVE